MQMQQSLAVNQAAEVAVHGFGLGETRRRPQHVCAWRRGHFGHRKKESQEEHPADQEGEGSDEDRMVVERKTMQRGAEEAGQEEADRQRCWPEDEAAYLREVGEAACSPSCLAGSCEP